MTNPACWHLDTRDVAIYNASAIQTILSRVHKGRDILHASFVSSDARLQRLRERIPEGLAPLQEQISEQDVVQQGSNRTVDTKVIVASSLCAKRLHRLRNTWGIISFESSSSYAQSLRIGSVFVEVTPMPMLSGVRR